MPPTCATPQSIAGHCGANAKNIKPRVWLANPNEIDSIPAATAGVISTDIVMKTNTPAFVFAVWNISPVDPGFTGESSGDLDGIEIPISLSVFIPAMEGAKSDKINQVNGGEYVVIVEDKNGKKWILGELNDGAFIRAGVQTNDKNGYPITIEWTTARLPYEYTGVIPV